MGHVELPAGGTLGLLDLGNLAVDVTLHLEEAAPPGHKGGREELRQGVDSVENDGGMLDSLAVVGASEEVVSDIGAVCGILAEMVTFGEGILVDNVVSHGRERV